VNKYIDKFALMGYIVDVRKTEIQVRSDKNVG